jgi:MFS family permease
MAKANHVKHLVGQQYSWVSSVFNFGYLGASFPASIGFVKFPLGKYLAVTIILWSIILTCHGATTNFAGLVSLRLLLGAFESVVSPGFSLMTSIVSISFSRNSRPQSLKIRVIALNPVRKSSY